MQPNVIFPPVRDKAFPLVGGVDYVSSHLNMAPGALIAATNVEVNAGASGYTRQGGIERCNNDILPSKTVVFYFIIESAVGAISVGDTFTSGALSIRSLVASATPQDGDILPVATHHDDDDFVDGSTFTNGGVSFDLTTILVDTSSYTSEEMFVYLRQAIELTRDSVVEVPGTGLINGGFRLRGKNYAFREGKLYEGGDFSWTEITMPDVIFFDEGTVAFTVGDTLTDGTATGTITSITRQTGSWDAGAAAADQSAGYITLSNVVGTFGAVVAITDGAGGAAKSTAANYTYVMQQGGKYEVKVWNFTLVEDNASAFGVSGVGEAFEFGVNGYIPIYYPDTTYYPCHMNIHQERLQLFFPGGQFVYSVSREPRVFNPLTGAGSYSTNSEIVGSRVLYDNAEMIYCEDSTWMLIGDGIYSDDTAERNWRFGQLEGSVGVLEYSVADAGPPIFLSVSDLMTVKQTDTGAGFYAEHVAQQIKPYFEGTTALPAASIWVKGKSQYRIFMENGTGYSVCIIGKKQHGATPFQYPVTFTNVWTDVENGKELIFGVSETTGYLYRIDSGNSFDDSPITGSFRVPFYHYGTPRNEKHFPELIIELASPVLVTDGTEIQYTVNYDYGSPHAPRPLVYNANELNGTGGLYGSNYGYGEFIWSGVVVAQIHGYLDGYGANMSILVNFSSQYDSPFTFLTAIVDFIELGRKGRK